MRNKEERGATDSITDVDLAAAEAAAAAAAGRKLSQVQRLMVIEAEEREQQKQRSDGRGWEGGERGGSVWATKEPAVPIFTLR